jgi:hypothetical protein
MQPYDFSLVDTCAINFLKENPNKKFTVLNLYKAIRKKYIELNFSHSIFYERIPVIQQKDNNVKTERLGNYIIIWYEKNNV